MPELANRSECSGCMACIDACPKSAISSQLDTDGHIYPRIDSSKCINCGLCEKTCAISSKLNYTESENAIAYAAWAKNKDARKQSASGGAFLAMAEYILSNGGIVFGAAMDGVADVNHICIDNIKDIFKLQGSKYAHSNAAGIYKQVFSYLKDGKLVLFSGTGCQVAGLYGFLSNKKYGGQLVTVDLICGGVPSRLLVDKFLENVPYEVKRIVSFRTKENGWSPKGFAYNLKIEDTSGIIHDYTNQRTLISTGFACEMTNRYSCYHCQFAGTNRMSDFTIGDYWGIKDYKEEHYNGVSAIIAHNDQAVSLLKEMNKTLTIQKTDISNILANNKRLSKVNDKRYLMPERKYLAWMFNHLSYKTICRIYALDFSSWSPWMIYKVYRLAMSKILK